MSFFSPRKKRKSIITNDIKKKYNKQKISGIVLTVIGIALILVGIIRYSTAYGWLGDLMELMYTLGVSIPLSLIGGGLLIHSMVLRKRMKNLEKLKEKKYQVRT